jgi:hypothetical protein
MAQAVSRRPVTPETGIDPRSVRVRLVVDKETVGQNFLRVNNFFTFSIIPQMRHVTLARKPNGRNLGPFQRAVLSRSVEKKARLPFL